MLTISRRILIALINVNDKTCILFSLKPNLLQTHLQNKTSHHYVKQVLIIRRRMLLINVYIMIC